MRKIAIFLSRFVPSKLLLYVVFIIKHRYIPNFRSPRSFNEKINFIRFNKTNFDLRILVSDRTKVREFVEQNAPECRLIDVLWVGEKITETVWNRLPRRFVVKANHGSGMVLIVDKEKESFSSVLHETQKWLNTDYGSKGREWFYLDLDRKLVIESFLEFSEDVPPDFKFFCFNGRVEMVQVDLDRFKGHKRNLYDREFNRIQGKLLYDNGADINKPEAFDKGVRISEKLSSKFDFIRVDLYLIEENVYFGELTNIPENGLGRFYPRALDFELGQKLTLTDR